MSTRVCGDATGFKSGYSMNPSLSKETQDDIKDAMEEANKARAYASQQLRQGNDVGRRPVNVKVSGGGGGGIPWPTNTMNQFNINGGTIRQATFGNTGPVTFHQEKKVFNEGAENNDIKITGGNFAQANVGGSATYNNKDTTVNAGSHGAGITIESLVLSILEKGVTAEEFTKLLEARYSLANIVFSMPKDPDRRRRMINTLLAE